MKWSKDKPTEEGCYWYRGFEECNFSENGDVINIIIKIEYHKKEETGKLFAQTDFRRYEITPLDELDGEFAGPIPFPAEG
jgi:hypothetical protein